MNKWTPIGKSGLSISINAQSQINEVLVEKSWLTLKDRFDSKSIGFFDLPINDSENGANDSVSLAEELLELDRFTDCLFIGIGGSALGPISFLEAVAHRREGAIINFHFQENPDPVHWELMIRDLDPARTLVCVVTKSGTTFETLSLFALATEWLGKELWRDQIIVITDPSKGELRAWANEVACHTLSIPPNIGGRYSIFCPVGTFAIALAGLSVEDFMEGAALARETFSVLDNPILNAGEFIYSLKSSHPIHVMMPYSTRLKRIADWWVQLWGESLGKNNLGFTPLSAVGAIDQHSLLQLLRDGPNDKLISMVQVKNWDGEIKIPKLSPAGPTSELLAGKSLATVLQTEYDAIQRVFINNNRPLIEWQLYDLSEKPMGAFYFSLATLTAYLGTRMGIDPFDQPGVEEGKKYIREMLS